MEREYIQLTEEDTDLIYNYKDTEQYKFIINLIREKDPYVLEDGYLIQRKSDGKLFLHNCWNMKSFEFKEVRMETLSIITYGWPE